MEVYIVIGIDAGGTDILRVFDSLEKAKEYISDINNPDLDGYAYVTYDKRLVE